VGPPVHKQMERISAADARASGAEVPFARVRGAKKPKLNYFIAPAPTIVPPGGATAITVGTCPSGQRIVSGFYETDRLIAADHFKAQPPGSWEFGFADFSGVQGLALEGIVCAKGVK
jgi:hypothetical protein